MNRCRGIVAVLIGGLVSAALMAAGAGTLKVQVLDSEGAVMRGAHVLVRPDVVGRQESSRATQEMASADQAGRLTRALEPGPYDVWVMADGFVPACQKVRIRAENTKIITVRLKFDLNAMRESPIRFDDEPMSALTVVTPNAPKAMKRKAATRR